MTDKEKKGKEVQKEYEELVKRLREELPNIILPSMGMLDDTLLVDIDGKDYIINDSVKEE